MGSSRRNIGGGPPRLTVSLCHRPTETHSPIAQLPEDRLTLVARPAQDDGSQNGEPARERQSHHSQPGLLQTADYARAVIETTTPAIGSAMELERMVARRLTRQHVLRQELPPTFHVVLDESILLRWVGGRPTMRDQLRKLADLAGNEHITIQVMPLTSGGGPGVLGPFTLLSLPQPAPDVVYGESPVAGSVYVSDADLVRTCTLQFGMLSQLALTRAESAERLAEAARCFE